MLLQNVTYSDKVMRDNLPDQYRVFGLEQDSSFFPLLMNWMKPVLHRSGGYVKL